MKIYEGEDGFVVLFLDEVDKVHLSFWRTMMEFLDSGSFSGPSGIEIRNCIVLMAGNYGQDQIVQLAVESKYEGLTEGALKRCVSAGIKASGTTSDVLGRLGEIACFVPLAFASYCCCLCFLFYAIFYYLSLF